MTDAQRVTLTSIRARLRQIVTDLRHAERPLLALKAARVELAVADLLVDYSRK